MTELTPLKSSHPCLAQTLSAPITQPRTLSNFTDQILPLEDVAPHVVDPI